MKENNEVKEIKLVSDEELARVKRLGEALSAVVATLEAVDFFVEKWSKMNGGGAMEGGDVDGASRLNELPQPTMLKGVRKIRELPVDGKESEIWEALGGVTSHFMELPDHHPTAKEEWCFYMHGLQGLMEHRMLKRLYPDRFN